MGLCSAGDFDKIMGVIMYLNKGDIEALVRSTNGKIRGWGIAAGIFFLALLGGMLPNFEGENRAGTIVLSVILFSICALFICMGIVKKSKLKLAYRFNNVFENDSDGVMKINEIANAMHMPKEKTEKALMWLMNNDFLINCRFDDKAPSTILLTDVNVSETNDFVAIQCPACGAYIQARPGQGMKCPACNTFVKA